MIKEEIKLIKETPADLRKFGITIGTVLLIAGVVFYLYDKSFFVYLLGSGILIMLAGLIIPTILKPFNKSWMILAILLGWVMTRVILSILFFFVVTPIGLIAKLLRKKFLKLDYDKNAVTYWEKRSLKQQTADDYERQF